MIALQRVRSVRALCWHEVWSVLSQRYEAVFAAVRICELTRRRFFERRHLVLHGWGRRA